MRGSCGSIREKPHRRERTNIRADRDVSRAVEATITDSSKLTIVLPTRDRPAELQQCLLALSTAADSSTDLIIVDDGSCIEVDASAFAFPERLTVIRLPESKGSSFARNIGAATATGDLLLFLDDDVCATPSSIVRVKNAFAQNPDLGAVFGRYDDEPRSPEFYSQFRNLLHSFTHTKSSGAASTFWTGFGAVRTSLFRNFDGFSNTRWSIDDVELGTRLSKAGVRIELRDDIQVKHLKRWTLKSALRTDLLLRGIPWTLLVWREQGLPDTLNLRYRSRCSVAMAAICFVLFAEIFLHQRMILLLPLVLAAMTLLNLDLFAFFRRQRGLWFTLRSVPMHWLYLWTAALSFIVGTGLYGAVTLLRSTSCFTNDGWRSFFGREPS